MNEFRRDLAAAGIVYETDLGFADFHSLRVTFATLLARAGVPLAMAQRLMRHSTPTLTANVYTKIELHDAAAAVARLPIAPAALQRDLQGQASSPCRSVPDGAHEEGAEEKDPEAAETASTGSGTRNPEGLEDGAGGGNRTHTSRRRQDFESCASASSATPARSSSAA